MEFAPGGWSPAKANNADFAKHLAGGRMNYDTGSIEFVINFDRPIDGGVLDLWQLIFPSVPHATYLNMPGGAQQAGGQVQGGFDVDVALNASQVNLSVTAPQATDLPAPLPFQPALKLALKAAKTIAAKGRTRRLALVSQHYALSDTSANAVVEVADQIPSLPFPRNALDIYYQVVTIRPSATSTSVEINCLCRWNTGAKVRIALNPERPTQRRLLAANKYFDVFTADGSEIKRSSSRILQEIADLTIDLVNNGYAAIA
jgi:hypothetical protein